MSRRYCEHAFSRELAGHVRAVWSSHEHAGTHLVLPDGCIDLLYESTSGRLFVVGTMTRALHFAARRPDSFVGVRFAPGGAVPFLGDRADTLTDRMEDADLVLGSWATSLRERLAGLTDARAIGAAMSAVLCTRRAAPVERRVAHAAACWRRDPSLPVEAVASDLGVSRQHLRRLFVEHTGTSPKAFARMARLERAAALLASAESLAGIAAEAGYADQAHLCRELKAIVGLTPSAYRSGLVPTVQDEVQRAG
jgi:AraC-like DNA-binding protein